MNWLLWREYRLNRAILVFGSVLILLPFVGAAFDVTLGGDRATAFFEADMATTACSAVIIALLAGNSIAGERSDRSAEFVAYLPLTRQQRLASKLFLPLTAVVVLCVVNVLLMPRLETWPADLWPLFTGANVERFQWSALLASAAFLVCGASWLVSSLQSSPTVAVATGLGIAILPLSLLEEPDLLFPWFPVAFITVAVGCFCFGSRNYLRTHFPPPWKCKVAKTHTSK